MHYVKPVKDNKGLYSYYASLIYSNAELMTTTYTEWTAGSYAKGDIVYIPNIERLLKSNIDANTTNPLDISTNFAGEQFYPNIGSYDSNTGAGSWFDLGAVNRYSCFDEFVINSRTIAKTDGEPLIIEIQNSKYDTLGFFGMLDVSDIEVELYDTLYPMYEDGLTYSIGDRVHKDDNKIYEWDGATWVYVSDVNQIGSTLSTALISRDIFIGDLWDWLIADFLYKTEANFTNLPLSFGGKIRIKLYSSTKAKVGMIVVGRKKFLGYTLYGASNSVIDFSYQNQDEDTGYIEVIKGASVKRVRLPFRIRDTSEQSDELIATVEELIRTEVYGNVCLFIGDERDTGAYTNLNILGVIEDGEISIESYKNENSYITIRGII